MTNPDGPDAAVLADRYRWTNISWILTLVSMNTQVTRRQFLQKSAFGGASLLVLTDSNLVFSTESNSKLNVAGIGVGGQGRSDLDNISGLAVNVVALCDVDHARAGDIFQKHPQAKAYTDFRRMFDDLHKSIDAVVVATPDHTH